MAKPNTYVLLKQAEKEIIELQKEILVLRENLTLAKGFTIQQCLDMSKIALNQEFGFGPVYNARFDKRFRKVFVEYASLCVEDGTDDEEIWYTKDVLDRDLRAAAGDDIPPFDDRYATERLYLRDTCEQWKEG